MRNRGAYSSGKTSQSCCTTQGDVGWAVTPKWMIFRRPWLITNQAYSKRNRTVGTTMKSIAARLTEKPSFTGSAWTFRARQSFSLANRRMRACSSVGIGGRPGPRFEMDRQYSRNPLRCQRMTVSGCTMTRVSLHPNQIRDKKTQKVRSTEVIRGLDPFRAKVASCWRSASSTIP
jgi:hypothetical protein